MTSKLLLPHKYKVIGWYLLVPATLLGLLFTITDFKDFSINAKVFAFFNTKIFEDGQSFTFIITDILSTIIGALFIIGAMFVGFSKEKKRMNLFQNFDCLHCFGQYG